MSANPTIQSHGDPTRREAGVATENTSVVDETNPTGDRVEASDSALDSAVSESFRQHLETSNLDQTKVFSGDDSGVGTGVGGTVRSDPQNAVQLLQWLQLSQRCHQDNPVSPTDETLPTAVNQMLEVVEEAWKSDGSGGTRIEGDSAPAEEEHRNGGASGGGFSSDECEWDEGYKSPLTRENMGGARNERLVFLNTLDLLTGKAVTVTLSEGRGNFDATIHAVSGLLARTRRNQ